MSHYTAGPEPPDRVGGPEAADHQHPHTTIRHHPNGTFILRPGRRRRSSWATVACLDRACVYCRCGLSREPDPDA